MDKRYIVGAVVAALIVVGVLVGLSMTGGGDDEGAGIEGAAEVREMLDGIPQDGNALGDPEAPVEIVEYGDLACPACQIASEETVPELIERYVAEGEARLVFRPIAFISQSSERGALGVIAAEEQDAAWSLTELLYANQGDESSDWLTEDLMEEAVAALDLDVEAWREAYEGDSVVEEFSAYRNRARADGVSVTPTFVVSGPNGEESLEGAANISSFQEAIDEVGPAR